MDVQQLLSSITPTIYQQLKRAVELGKWPDGNRITTEQRHLCIQAMIAYERNNLPEEQRTGYIPSEPHQACGVEEDRFLVETPIKWIK